MERSGAAGLRAAEPGQAPRGAPPRGAVRLVAWAAGTAAAAVVLFGCYLLQSRTVSAGSDGASQVLQAWDMAHGNPLLRGWWLTDVPLYTTELPQYVLVEWVRGLSADVMHVAGAMTYTLLVLFAAFLARGRARGADGLIRAALAAGIMLAPQLSATGTLILSPDHTGTGVPVLAVLLFVDLARPRWYVPAVTCLALAWIALADAITVFVAIIPLALVFALRAFQGAVLNREGMRARWFELSMAAAAVVSVPVEIAATRVIQAHGGWHVHGLQTGLANSGMLAGNARLTGRGLLELFGADFAGAGGGPGVAFAAVHLAGVALAVCGFAGAVGLFFRRDAIIEPVLVTGIVIDVAAYLGGVQAVNMLSTREIAPVLPFAAVLAGRVIGPRLAAGRLPGVRPVLGALLACYAAMLGYSAAQPSAAPQYADLSAWLAGHHLSSGLSGYSQANIVTAESGGTVTLRPVAGHGGHVAGYLWNSSVSWFDPASHSANFLVLSTVGNYEVTGRSAVATFGPPARTYRYRVYTILVWHQNLLARMPRPLALVATCGYLCGSSIVRRSGPALGSAAV